MTLDNIIEFPVTLSRIIDFRSHFTASYSYTVAHLASLLGGYFGFCEEGCKKLLVSGYLHDIGKIGIDPGLREKNGLLNTEAFNLVKLHAYYTGRILNELSSSEWFRKIVKWAERHHEKSDGCGYPYSLDGSSLDIGSKIVAFLGVLSVLREDHPCRRNLTIDVAFKIIREYVVTSIYPICFG